MQLHFFGVQAACVRHMWWWTQAKLAIVFTYFFFFFFFIFFFSSKPSAFHPLKVIFIFFMEKKLAVWLSPKWVKSRRGRKKKKKVGENNDRLDQLFQICRRIKWVEISNIYVKWISHNAARLCLWVWNTIKLRKIKLMLTITIKNDFVMFSCI